MADIFISYKREDRAWAEALSGALKAQGWSVWWDTRLAAGNSFDDVIEAEMEKARCVIVLWSAASVKSRWVRAEAGEGLEREILVPVLIEHARPPLAFRRIQTGNLVGWNKKRTDAKFIRLVEDVSKLIGPPLVTKEASELSEPQKHKASDPPIHPAKKFSPWLVGSGALVLALLLYWFWPSSNTPASQPAAPTALLSALQTRIEPGDSTQLRWSTSHASTVYIEPDIGSVSAFGSQFVAPDQTTTYTLTAEGAGQAIDTLLITVGGAEQQAPSKPNPVANFSVDLSSIERGESTTLRWGTTNATSVRIDQGIGTVALDGSHAVEPARTTTYTLTASHDGATVRETVRIQVREPLTVRDPCANSSGIDFNLIKAGSFEMGSNEGNNDEKPPHRVRINKDFCMGTYEVTQAQWAAIKGDDPSRFKGSNRPVERVSWDDVQDFISKLNAKENCGGCYRLPTEAEWEYAARAGTTTVYSFGDDASQLGSYAWYGENSDTVGKVKIGRKMVC